MSRNNQWFQPGEGIAREVITADIQRYLGPDALVRPGEGNGEYQGVQGYWITAYRTLTSQMVQDLKLDSQRWRAEVAQGRGSPLVRDHKSHSRHPDQAVVAYQDSRTHQSRQYYGPTSTASAPAADPYAQPSHSRQAYAPSYQSDYGQDYTHQPQTAYSQPTAYTAAHGAPRTTAPTYAYSQQPASGRDPYSAYSPHGQQPVAYTYAQQPASQPAREQAYAQPPPSTSSSYYTTSDGRTYAGPPTQQPANHGRRRG